MLVVIKEEKSGHDEPAAETGGGKAGSTLEKKAALLSADDYGIAVQVAVLRIRPEGADILDRKNAAVRPGDGPGLHIACLIKIGRDLNI